MFFLFQHREPSCVPLKVQVVFVLQLFNGNVIHTVRSADTGSFALLEQCACYIMMPLHAAVISLYNQHRTRACRVPKQEVQKICHTDVSLVTSACASSCSISNGGFF